MTHPSLPEAEIPEDVFAKAVKVLDELKQLQGESSLDKANVIARAILAERQRAIALQPISTAPDLERVMVAGWQPRNGNVAGYWWYEEGMADGGRDLENPRATHWFPISLPAFPAAPVEGA